MVVIATITTLVAIILEVITMLAAMAVPRVFSVYHSQTATWRVRACASKAALLGVLYS